MFVLTKVHLLFLNDEFMSDGGYTGFFLLPLKSGGYTQYFTYTGSFCPMEEKIVNLNFRKSVFTSL